MSVLGALACAVAGIGVGLFLNVVIDRVPAREGLLPLRFRCPHRPRVAVGDDGETERTGDGADTDAEVSGLPVAAWLRPGGRCPVCGAPLPLRYLLVPVATAVLFAAAALRFGADWVLPAYLLFFAALLAISVVDFQRHIIPNRIVYPAIFASIPLLALAAGLGHDVSDWVRALISGAAAWTALFVIHLISPRGMGFGDVRLSFLLGLFLGWLSYGHVVTGIFLGFMLGAVVGLALIALRLRKRTDHVPFGPFLAAGAVLAVLFADPFVETWL